MRTAAESKTRVIYAAAHEIIHYQRARIRTVGECQRSGVALAGSGGGGGGAVSYRMSRCNSHPFERTRPYMMNCTTSCAAPLFNC